MKERFSTVDLLAVVEYFNRRLLGMRAANIYDIDHKTYLIKLARSEEKAVLLFESGCRIHTTEFDWPKGMMPSGFAMKLRKHLRSKRLVGVTQLGVDRVVDLQFGSNEHAHHLIIELYDRGNVILTDYEYTILSLLRVRTDTDTDVRFAIREKFSMETIKMSQPTPTREQILEILSSAKSGDQLKHVLNPHFVFGPGLLTHCIIGQGLSEHAKIGVHIDFKKDNDVDIVLSILTECFQVFELLRSTPCKGYLIQKRETGRSLEGAEGNSIVTNLEFHPMLFRQHCSAPYEELETFNKAVDLFFSTKTSQKQEMKVHQMEKAAVKKLDNIQQDHQKRLQALKQSQDEDRHKAHLIEVNTDIVEKACLVIRSAVAASMDWGDIDLLVREAQGKGDPVALAIQGLKLASNQITLILKDVVIEDEVDQLPMKKMKGIKVDIDLSITAYANAQKYYSHKKSSAKKEQKTIESSKKALKSAEKKAKQSLKEAAVVSRIQKARKVLWFEKFYWFISSENYLVIGGRDQQQNELIVKKYLNNNDLYVHADLHGATSVVIKNTQGGTVTPKTLNEAGIMAVCYSSAWEAKIITNAWWVYANQVSKTAPTGEYLTTGSFMIRGKKNYLPPCQLTLGFSIMFKLEETCIANHLNERRVKGVDDDLSSVASEPMSELTMDDEEEIHVPVEEQEDNDGHDDEIKVDSDHHDSADEDGCGLLDTAIQIQSKGGISLEFHRNSSNTSAGTDTLSELFVQHGGDTTEITATTENSTGRKHLSAKERRMLKKKGHDKTNEELESVDEENKREINEMKKQQNTKEYQPQQAQSYKRGQKSKQKKIRDKYGDQDEDERVRKMEILASSGIPKEIKVKKSKGNKGKRGDMGQSFNPKAKYHQKNKDKTHTVFAGKQHKQQGPLVIEEEMTTEEMEKNTEHHKECDIFDNVDGSITGTEIAVASTGPSLKAPINNENPISSSHDNPSSSHDNSSLSHDNPSLSHDNPSSSHDSSHDNPSMPVEDIESESDSEEKQAIMDEENLLQLEEAEKNNLVIDSLTGSPLPDDLMLFSVPVCAPYSALHDYKFKVKLVPGTNRRGKAAKTAVYKFIQMKETSQLEKDLLRSIKDNDLSRYFPGKVKMTIPQQILRTKR